MENVLEKYSHKRYNILTGEWILVSPHRSKRPWQGQNEEIIRQQKLAYDPNCYLCPGNERINGEKNPNYKDVYVFTNDFSALQADSQPFSYNDKLFKAKGESGICRVLCFSPDHRKSLADMDVDAIEKVVQLWKDEFISIGSREFIDYVQIFENKGAVMGCSNPHPHGQIWSQSTLPNEVRKKDRHMKRYYQINNRSILSDYLRQELLADERIVFENEHFVVLVPFWAVWPFETMIIPKRSMKDISIMTPQEDKGFAEAISVTTNTYDRLFNCSFPYSSGIHQAPTNSKNNEHWHWHMSFYPPLLRSASIKKFMVGYEMFGSPQRDITAEQAARRLKTLVSKQADSSKN